MNTAALDSLLHWLLRTSLEASVLILAVLTFRAILRTKLSPAWRIGLWMVVGLKLLLPACIPAGFGLGHWWATKTQTVAVSQSTLPSETVVQETRIELETVPAARLHAPHHGSALSLSAWGWFLLWAAGALTVLSVAILRQRRFEKQLACRPLAHEPRLLNFVTRLARLAGLRQQVQVVMMPAGTTPAVTGCRHARLLLPEDWETRFDDVSLRHVLLHELQHVRQNDLIWNWAALAVQALHWFNPLVWLVGSRFQADRELRCDARALALLSPNERLSYGHTLLRVQETFFAPPAVAGLAPCVRNHPTLLQRITMIAQPTRQRPWLQAAFTLAFGFITCYAFTTARAVEKEVPAKDRSREGTRNPAAGESTTKTSTPRERDGGEGKMNTGDRDGNKPKTGERDGAPRSGERDGMRKKSAEADGAPRTGPRDGEKPKTGDRDGARPKTGERDGPRKGGERDGAKTTEKRGDTAEAIAVQVTDGGDSVVVAGEKMPANRLRGYLQTLLADKGSAKVTITGDADVTQEALFGVQDAVRDNGAKNVRIQSNAKE